MKEVKKETIVNFIQIHLIYRYGIPHYIITDNGKHFYNKLMMDLYEKFGFKQYKSSHVQYSKKMGWLKHLIKYLAVC